MERIIGRLFNGLVVLVVLISQFGFMPGSTSDVRAAPATVISPTSPSFAGVTISNVKINGSSNSEFVSPGSPFTLSLDYSIIDANCPGCIDEIQIGLSNESAPFDCAYTGIPGAAGVSGSATINATAPSAPGVYYLAFDRAQHFTCSQALAQGWWNGTPGPNRYIARLFTTTLIVNSTADTNDGSCDASNCTLREAINTANNNEGADFIAFNIPGAGVQTISPTSALPTITDSVTIDGYTQSDATPNTLTVGNNAVLRIELNGTSAGNSDGLAIRTSNSIIRGLVVNRFAGAGISVSEVNNQVAGNFIGTDSTGTFDRGNGSDGVFVANFTQPVGASNNVIGGSAPADRNVISANGNGNPGTPRNGITLDQVTSTRIFNNYIGTNAGGTAKLGNYQTGIGIFRGLNNVVGGGNAGEGNLISGNIFDGIGMSDLSQEGGHVVQGNRIGTDASGNPTLGNGRYGILLNTPHVTVGGTTASDGNTIAGNGSSGVMIGSGTSNTIRSNKIYSNNGLGIDLDGEGVTFNHQGSVDGPNNYQNYPVLTLATSNGTTTRLMGSLVSDSNQTYSIDVYSNSSCDPSAFGEAQTSLGSFDVTTDGNGVASFDQTIDAAVPEPDGITATATGSNGTSEFSYCRPVSTPNLNWVQAQAVSSGSQIQQFLTDRFQEKWFKFPVQPGSTVTVTLTGLPGSAVSLHRDPLPIYNSLINPQNGAVLSAEAADTAFLPSGSLPSGSLPSGSLPSGSLPSGSLPSGSLPTGYLPSGSLPSGSLPSGSLPSGSLPSGSLPSGSLPSGSLPSGSLPSGSLPSGSLPSGSLPSGSLPSGSLPSGSLPSGSLPSGSLDAYASAARRSVLGISMDPYATVQTIERNTYDLQENLYVRVVGPYNIETPFTLDVTVQGGVCGTVQSVPDNLAAPTFASGSYQTLILTDSQRLPGTSAEKTTALNDLNTFASRTDVNGKVIDLSNSAYGRVAFANTQADQHPACAFAKNTVASEIKKVSDAFRAANPNLTYIVLAGGGEVIPFFQVQDVAGLADEKDYVVPVAPSTPSEAGLKTNLVQGQDAYGSQLDIEQAGHTLAFPGLAVGRLVDTASDISTAVNTYIQNNGILVPHHTLVTGYDFVGDAAQAVKSEMDQGTGSTADTLIQNPGLPPTDPTAWTASQLRTKLVSGNFDIAMLSGHFSAGSLLAADYTTQLTAADIFQSTANLNNDLILALGCHSGYTIPSPDFLANASPSPDWAQAFLRKGAAGYISATGYAYGDTDLTSYGERLFVLMAQQLRTGTGPVAIGKAVMEAKRQYLAETPQLTGIDLKTITEMTLYGFPMMKVDMPGARILTQTDASIVGATDPVSGGPGASVGLKSADVTLNPIHTDTHTKTLQNLVDNSTIVTTYLSGKDGVVANPFEPIYPKEIDNVTASGQVLRGMALRGGSYADTSGITPLTSSPTTETSTAHLSYYTDVFYPTQTWMANYFDTVAGGSTNLMVIPAQFRSRAPGATDGTLRTFTNLNFQLYYLPGNWTSTGSAATKAAAVSAAPTILGASASESSSGDSVTFHVNAAADGSAGVQAVWVLYTGTNGSAYHGTWSPLDLVQDANDPTLWDGTLHLQAGESAQNILFMVQAVGGAGLTTLATNLGAYYSVTPQTTTPPPPPAETTLTLQRPASGTYLKNSTFRLSLNTAGGGALANQLLTLNVGGQQVFGVTDSSGNVTLTLKPVVAPGDYTAQASFRGNADDLGSNATAAFSVTKDTTTLTVTPASASIPVDQATPFVATLHDSSGSALGGKSIFFVVHNATQFYGAAVIADYQGNAALGKVPLPPGTYTVDAYFNGTIPLGTGNPLVLSDDDYQSSNRLGLSLTLIGDTTPPTISVSAVKSDNTPYVAGAWTNQTVTVHFICSDAGSGIAACPADQSFNTDGTFTANGTATDNANNSASASFALIRIDKTAPTLSPVVSPNPVRLGSAATVTAGAADTGSGLASQSCGALDTSSLGTRNVTCLATDNAGNTKAATVSYQVIKNFPMNAVLDTFNRANGGAGSNWAISNGTNFYKIASNRLDVQLGGALVWKPVSFGVSQEAFVTISTIDAHSSSLGVMLKAQSTGGTDAGVILVVYDAPAGALRVSTLRAIRLVWTDYGKTSVAFSNGDQLGARALANGTVQVYKNGMLIATVTLNTADQSFFNTKGGRIGLWALAAPNAFLDDFGGGSVSP